MTTNSEVIERVLKRLGNRSSEDLRAYAELEIQTKIQEYEQGPLLPWFLEIEQPLQAVVDTETVDLPADFLREVEGGGLRIQTVDGVWQQLTKLPLDKMRKEVADEDSGLPEAYAMLGSYIYLAPIPDSAYALRLVYYRRSVEFQDSADTATDWCAHATNLVVYGAAAQIAAAYILNDQLAGSLAVLEERAKQALYMDTEARQNTNLFLNIED